jgi:hypothetical protein
MVARTPLHCVCRLLSTIIVLVYRYRAVLTVKGVVNRALRPTSPSSGVYHNITHRNTIIRRCPSGVNSMDATVSVKVLQL